MPSVRRHTQTCARLSAPFSCSDSVGNVAASGTPYSWTNLLNMAIRSRSLMIRIASIFGTWNVLSFQLIFPGLSLSISLDVSLKQQLQSLTMQSGASMGTISKLGIKWYQFVRNDDARRQTKQPKLTDIIQSRRLSLFGRMDDNADAKRILLASPLADWRRQPGRPRITWLSTVQQDLKQHHLTLPEAADLAQNCPLWRMMSMYGTTQS